MTFHLRHRTTGHYITGGGFSPDPVKATNFLPGDLERWKVDPDKFEQVDPATARREYEAAQAAASATPGDP